MNFGKIRALTRKLLFTTLEGTTLSLSHYPVDYGFYKVELIYGLVLKVLQD